MNHLALHLKRTLGRNSTKFQSLRLSSSSSHNAQIKTTVFFCIDDKIGALDAVLTKLKALNISLSRIESRPSRTKNTYDFYIDFNSKSENTVAETVGKIRPVVQDIKVVSTESCVDSDTSVAWFPRKISDLDTFADKVLSMGEDLEADHPGFTDDVYRRRRAEITALAKTFKHGEKLPRIEYTKEEIETWGVVYDKLVKLYPTKACKEHRYVFPLLIQNCGYRSDNIPQLEDVSRFLRDCTGWSIRPVMGLLTPRDFLNGLAFRVFHSTQYIRHHSKPLYTPEPDVCHELLGHVPLYADPDFAEFSHEIGLASLGASEEEIKKLSTLYWFTVEFGLCKEGDSVKAYGAGLLSSFGELEYCLSDSAKKEPFIPETVAITQYQPVYFVAQSFREMKEQMRDYAQDMKRPFTLRYNALTQNIEVLDTKEKLVRYGVGIKSELDRLITALTKF